MKHFFSFIFLVCFLIFSNQSKLRGSSRKSEDAENKSLQFENNWDSSTAAEVEIDDIFTQIADQNLEKVEASNSGKGSIVSQTCADCVPTPANFR
jgi:hypothetical protein